MEDDLKNYEVHFDYLPVWYFDTIREYIVNYCPDMHAKNKEILLGMLYLVEERHKSLSNVVRLKRKIA